MARLDETVFFFMSDNGFARGEHRYGDKGCEYEECHRVPFVVVCPEVDLPRGDAWDGGCRPTRAQHRHHADDHRARGRHAAGSASTGGASFHCSRESDPSWRSSFLLEDHGITQLQSPLAITGYGSDGHLYKYVTFRKNTDLELYDLTTDPWELVEPG